MAIFDQDFSAQDSSDIFDVSRSDLLLRSPSGLTSVHAELEATVISDEQGHAWTYKDLNDTLEDLQALAGREWWEPVDVVVPAVKKTKVAMAIGYFHRCLPYIEPAAGPDGANFRLQSTGLRP